MSEVCQCKDKDHTVDICIGQYKEVMKQANRWFEMLQKYCEHRKDVLCQIPLEIHAEPGVIVCERESCPLVKD